MAPTCNSFPLIGPDRWNGPQNRPFLHVHGFLCQFAWIWSWTARKKSSKILVTEHQFSKITSTVKKFYNKPPESLSGILSQHFSPKLPHSLLLPQNHCHHRHHRPPPSPWMPLLYPDPHRVLQIRRGSKSGCRYWNFQFLFVCLLVCLYLTFC